MTRLLAPSSSSLERASRAALLRVPDGFEGAPLGVWCAVCGLEVAAAEQSLVLIEADGLGGDAARWLMPVHHACGRPGLD